MDVTHIIHSHFDRREPTECNPIFFVFFIYIFFNFNHFTQVPGRQGQACLIETTAELFLVNSENGKVTFLCLLSALYRSHSSSRIFFFLFFSSLASQRQLAAFLFFSPKTFQNNPFFLENVTPVHK